MSPNFVCQTKILTWHNESSFTFHAPPSLSWVEGILHILDSSVHLETLISNKRCTSMELGVLLSWSSVGPTLVFGLVFLVFYELHRYFSLLNKFPPGPKPWLLLGNLPEILKDSLKVFMDVSLTVFDTFSSYIGSSLLINIIIFFGWLSQMPYLLR